MYVCIFSNMPHCLFGINGIIFITVHHPENIQLFVLDITDCLHTSSNMDPNRAKWKDGNNAGRKLEQRH